MSPRVLYLSTTLALVAVAVVAVLLQGRLERPAPRSPAPRPPAWSAAPAVRPAALPPAPPTAREILDRAMVLDLRVDQVVRLQALDRLWRSEAGRLEGAIREAEREFSAFVKEAQTSRGTSGQEIQRRSAEWSELSAALREARQHHAEAALGLLADWQRQRLARMRTSAVSGGNDEAPRR